MKKVTLYIGILTAMLGLAELVASIILKRLDVLFIVAISLIISIACFATYLEEGRKSR